MGLKIIITNDFDQMSLEASKIVAEDIKGFQKESNDRDYVLGLATGNTPTGLYKHLARSANNKEFDPGKIVSFNLDEYIGLPGNNTTERITHPEGYAYFMIQELFSLLEKKFKKTYVPFGAEIDQDRLISELEKHKNAYEFLGADSGRQIDIKPNGPSEYLNWIKENILDRYLDEINAYGGIDLHVIGVGGRGHVAFHESGIPLDQEMLLVKLDDNTVQNAVEDGHFVSVEASPKYAVSMGAKAVYRAKTVLLVANGKRKTGQILESLLGEVTADIPISYSQKYSEEGGNMIYVLDEAAAMGIIDKKVELTAKGYEVIDKRK